jgi:hypothetical protein
MVRWYGMGKEDELKWEKEKERESELKGEIAEKYTLAVAKKKGAVWRPAVL